jgi:hypothetical protein
MNGSQGYVKVIYYHVKTTAHVHNYEHEQVPMVTDLHMRPVMGFLCLGTEAGGVYMRTLGQRLGTPILQQGELPSCPGEGIYAAVQVDPL